MKKRPKSLNQVFNEAYPNKTKNNQKDHYNSQIQHELEVYLPEEWQGKVKLKSYSEGILHLELVSAAHKMRFNGMRSGLLSHLRQIEPGLISINDKVCPPKTNAAPAAVMQNNFIQQQLTAKKQPAQVVSAKGKRILNQAKLGLPEELQQAIDKLLKD